jgi:hypothetical protein
MSKRGIKGDQDSNDIKDHDENLRLSSNLKENRNQSLGWPVFVSNEFHKHHLSLAAMMNQIKTKPRAAQNQQTGIYKPDAVKVGRALLDVR